MSQVSFETLFPEARTGTISLARGEMLFHKGEEADHIFTVAQGVVRLVRYSIEGKAVSMHTALSGDSFAEASLFSPIYHCDAEAVQSSTVTAYAKGAILDVLRRNGEKNMAFIALLSRQVRELRTLLEVRSIRSAREKVLHYLLLQANPATMEITCSGTMKAMAIELGIAHETLYRTLAELENQGSISRSSAEGKILINSVPDEML